METNNTKKACFFLFVFLLCFFISTRNANATEKTYFLEFTNEIDQTISRLFKNDGVIGAAVAFINGDTVRSFYYGYANIENKKRIKPNTIFQVGSISKSVTATGVLKLVEEGKISLDKPVNGYLNNWKLQSSEFDPQKVTIRRLLNHTAGISVSWYPGFHPDSVLPTLEESLSGRISEGFLGFFLNKPVRIIQESGLGFRYSGGGYTILQLLIEDVSGMSFSSFMKAQILSPLKMNSSSFDYPMDHPDELAIGYSGFFIESPSPNYIYTAKAAAGLYSTLSDLVLYLKTFFGKQYNAVLDSETIRLMTTPTIETDDGYFGLGCHIRVLSDGDQLVSHYGKNRGGWNASYSVLPEKKAGFVFLSNSENGSELRKEIEDKWIAWLVNQKNG